MPLNAAPQYDQGKVARPQHLPWIDWLRFLAAFMVLLVHVRGVSLPEYAALPLDQQHPGYAALYLLTRLRREAVLLFFVLSGFLVGGRILDRVMNGSFRLGDYALDRMTRIYIPLVPALLLSGLVAGFTQAPADAALFCMNLLGLQGVWCGMFGANDPLWTLSFEIWFYALGGALAWLVQTRRISFFVGAILFVALAVFSKLGSSFLFCWLLGALAWRTRPDKFSPLACGIGILLVGIGTAVTQMNIETKMDTAASLRAWLPDQTIVRLVLATGFGVVIQNLVVCAPARYSLASVDRWGAALAACSYTLYLTHYPVLVFLGHFGWKRADRISLAALGSFVGAMACCFAAAWVLWFLFESRTGTVRNWVRSRLAGSAPA